MHLLPPLNVKVVLLRFVSFVYSLFLQPSLNAFALCFHQVKRELEREECREKRIELVAVER